MLFSEFYSLLFPKYYSMNIIFYIIFWKLSSEFVFSEHSSLKAMQIYEYPSLYAQRALIRSKPSQNPLLLYKDMSFKISNTDYYVS